MADAPLRPNYPSNIPQISQIFGVPIGERLPYRICMTLIQFTENKASCFKLISTNYAAQREAMFEELVIALCKADV